jgi:hypothetical protein
VEQTISQRNSQETLMQDPAFAKIHNTSAQVNEVSVYLNFLHLKDLTAALFQPEAFNPSFVSQLASWSELDLEIRQDAISLNGLTLSDGTGSVHRSIPGNFTSETRNHANRSRRYQVPDELCLRRQPYALATTSLKRIRIRTTGHSFQPSKPMPFKPEPESALKRPFSPSSKRR